MNEKFNVLLKFYFPGFSIVDYLELNSGKIHRTYRITLFNKFNNLSRTIILQSFNRKVFPDFEKVFRIHNLAARELNSNKILSPTIIPTENGELYISKDDEIFRVLKFIPGRELNNNQQDIYQAAVALGQFHISLKQISPATIGQDSFHNLLKQSEIFLKYEYLLKLKPKFSEYFRIYEKLSYLHDYFQHDQAREICHNDPKIENFMMVKNQALLLDLDTISPGFYELDIADMVRSITKHLSIDEYLSVLKTIVSGYLESGQRDIDPDKLYLALLWIAFELFMRYLNDSVCEKRCFLITPDQCLDNADLLLSSLRRLTLNENRIKSSLRSFFLDT